MNTFETVIREAFASGTSFQDIAKEFSDALNQVEKKERSGEERKEFLGELRHSVDVHLQRHSYNTAIAAHLATLACAEKHPEWDVETLKEFDQIILNSIDYMGTIMSQDPAEMLTTLINELINPFPTRGKKVKKAAAAGVKPSNSSSSDADKVRAFLNSL